jgi:hypothetical protein
LTADNLATKMIVGASDSSSNSAADERALAAERNTRVSENIVTTSPSVSRSPVKVAVLLTLHAVFGVFIVWLLVTLVPKSEKMFKDFGAKLPDMTIMVIGLSALFTKLWFILVPGLVAGDLAIMLSLHRTGRARLITTLGVLLCLGEMLLIGLILLAIMVPLNHLITDLTGGK